jgi:hypothetical protein
LNSLKKSDTTKRSSELIMEAKGYSYTVEDEKILEYMKLTTEEKLQWLEEINAFTFAVLSDEEKLLRQKLRSGEI